MLKRAILAVLLSSAAVSAQPLQPANITTDRSVTPEVVQVLDQAGIWAPMGSINSSHVFTPVGGGGGGLSPIAPNTVLGNATAVTALPGALALPSCASLASALTYTLGTGFGCNIISGGSSGNASNGFINVTDPAIGMVANTGVDNYPKVATLMSALGPFTFAGSSSYDVIIPGLIGQQYTQYYFSEPFAATVGAHYRCTAPRGGSISLWFPPGVDGIHQNNRGSFEGCQIFSGGFGTAWGNAIGTHLSMINMYNGATASPPVAWHVGDSFIGVPFHGAYFSPDAEIAYPPGTLVTSVNGGAITGYISGRNLTTTSGNPGIDALLTGGGVAPNTYTTGGSGSSWTVSVTQALGSAGSPVSMSASTTLTLSNPANPYFADPSAANFLPQIPGDPPPWPNNGVAPVKGVATFTQTGNNNFNNNDTINVAGVTYTFSTFTPIGGSHNVGIGLNFDASAANLVAAVKNATGQFATYSPQTAAVRDYNLKNQFVDAAHLSGSGVITFTSLWGGAASATFPSVYTTTGTAAGSFGAATFVGGDTPATCPSPCMYLNAQLAISQLPAIEAFHITAVTGSSRFGWSPPAAPHYQLYTGDKIWSEAFPFGSGLGQIVSASLFVEAGANNFTNGDQLLAGNNTWTFRTSPSLAGDVAIGPDFQTSGKNLGAAMANITLGFSGYIAGTTLTVPTPPATPLSVGGFITGAGVTAGTKIVSGSGTSFVVNNSQTVGSSGALVAMQEKNYVAAAVTSNVQNTGTVGPTWMVIYATGFNAPTSYHTSYTAAGTPAGSFTTGSDFSQYWEINVFSSGAPVAQLSTKTYAPGSEGLLWNIPTGLKRNDAGQTKNLSFERWGIGMLMSCGTAWGFNCDLARDSDNFHQLNMVGRWADGDNYASSSASDEQFSDNFIADDLELGTLGESLYNPNYESTEAGTSHYGILQYCLSQNSTTIHGGYIGGGNMCDDPTKVIPAIPNGGPASLGVNSGTTNGPNIYAGTICCGKALNAAQGGNDGQAYINLGGPAGSIANFLTYDSTNGGSGTQQVFGYSALNKDYPWFQGVGTPSIAMKFANGASLDYSGSGGYVTTYPPGIILGGDPTLAIGSMRLFGMTNGKPTALWHRQGDTEITTNAVPGSMAAWYSGGGSTSLTGVLNGTQLAVQQEIDPTPLPTLATNGSGYSLATPTTPDVTGTLTGNFASCTTQPVLNVTADGPTGVIQSINSVAQKGVCAPAATFTGSVAGTTLTITGTPNGTILVGSFLTSSLAVIPGTTIISGAGLSWQVSASQTIASSSMTATQLVSGLNAPAWTPGGAMLPGTGAFPNVVWEQALTPIFTVPAGPPGINQTLAGTGVIAGTKITAGAGDYWTVNQTYGSPIGPETITGQSWYPAMAVSNDPVNPDFTAIALRSGSAANKDLTGRITLSGGVATFVMSEIYVSAPNCFSADVTTPANANSVSESAPVAGIVTLTFAGTGSDILKYLCAGRN